jgi:colanic acid biosynthesis protein WcaH
MDLRSMVVKLEAAVGDPRNGLPEEVFLFVSRSTPLINVDLLIKDDHGRTLLTWRNDEFFGAGWHVPGGIIRYKEPIGDRIRVCARQELGADVSFDPAPLLVAETILAQNSRGHFISLLYRCELGSPLDSAKKAMGDRPSSGEWSWHAGCPSNLLEVQRHYARFL